MVGGLFSWEPLWIFLVIQSPEELPKENMSAFTRKMCGTLTPLFKLLTQSKSLISKEMRDIFCGERGMILELF
jgi:hypothetical protein